MEFPIDSQNQLKWKIHFSSPISLAPNNHFSLAFPGFSSFARSMKISI
jgi:hypothetical protein